MPRTLLGQVLLGVVLLAATALRLVALDLTAFNIDEARLCIAAGSVLHGQGLPWHGIRTSFGFHNPPLLVWMAIPAFAATADPMVAMALLVLGGVLACVLAGDAVRRVFGPAAGAAALVVVAFSPAAVDHCRRLWGHDTIVFWSALALWCAVRGVQSRRWPWLGASGAMAACAQACHLSGALVWVVPLGALAAFPVPGRAKAFALAVAIAGIVYAPWLAEDAGLVGDGRSERFGQVRLVAATAMGRAGEAGTPGHSSPGSSWLTVLADLRNNDHMGDEYPGFLADRPGLNGALLGVSLVLAVLQLAGVAVAVARGWRERAAPSDEARWMVVLAAAAVAPLLLFSMVPVSSVPPYQLPALVPCAALAATIAARALRGRLHAAVAGCALAGLCAWHALALRHHLANAGFESRVGGLLRHKRQVVDFVAAVGGSGSYAIMQDGRAPEAGLDYWVAYLHAATTGKSRTPTAPADRVFVVRDGRTLLRTEPLAILESAPHLEIGIFRVYQFDGRDAERWIDAVRRNPSTREEAP